MIWDVNAGSENHGDFNTDLYQGFSEFVCDPGCIACCRGIVSLAVGELLAIEAFCAGRPGGLAGFGASAPETGCPFRTEAGCAVYPVRPFMCRLFGFRFLHPDLAGQPFCPRRMQIRPGDAEAEKYKFYQRFCEENGFAIIGQPRDPNALPAAVAENRKMAARFPDIARFVRLLAGGEASLPRRLTSPR